MAQHVFIDFSPGRVKMLQGELQVGEETSPGLCLVPQPLIHPHLPQALKDARQSPLSVYLAFRDIQAINELINALEKVKMDVRARAEAEEPLPLEG
jgi:hypothetical protein